MNAKRQFSCDYATARKRFRITAAQADWSVESHPIEATGPHGERLTLDAAVSPDNGAERAVVISSGLHGVELPLGSAVQLETIERWAELSAGNPPVRCVLWHGLNPYGAAWSCRTNERNVDLNRNFLLTDETFAGSPPGYADLSALLNPAGPPRWWDAFYLRAATAVLRHGMPKLRQAIAAGQYDFPRGLFFGGNEVQATQRIVGEHLPRQLRGVREVVHLDVHTGLGRRGTGKMLLENPLTERQAQRMTTWFGEENFEAATSEGIAYAARGGWGRWCAARKMADDYLFACAEFGTYGPLQVLAGLRRENQARHYSPLDSRATQSAKRNLRELFCPEDSSWRSATFDTLFKWIRRALKGFANDA